MRRLHVAISLPAWLRANFTSTKSKNQPDSAATDLSNLITRFYETEIVPVVVANGPTSETSNGPDTEPQASLQLSGAQAMGVQALYASGSAPAACVALQRTGQVDWVLTKDAEAFLYGAAAVRSDEVTTKDGN